MRGLLHKWIFAAAVLGTLCNFAAAQESATPESTEVLISVADQRLVLLRDGGLVKKYRISTSKFGTGDAMGSYKTPLGRLRVCDKIGGDLDPGTVIKHRQATDEIIPVNAPGRDPIVTRVLWLDGLDDGNRNARTRGIYIHGTPEESNLGKPVSWGCIRMRSSDVIELYGELPPGAQVNIIADRLPRLHKYEPPKPVIIAEKLPAPEHPTAQIAAASKTIAASPKNAEKPAAPVAPSKLIAFARDEEMPEKKPVHADAGALKAMKGSILLAGLADLDPSAPKPAQQTAKSP